MDLLKLAITFLLVIIFANIFLLFAPPQPALTVGALAVGTILGLAVSRYVVLPAIAKYSAD